MDLVVRRDEFVALLSPYGGGKTTLLNLLGVIKVAGDDAVQKAVATDLRDRFGLRFRFGVRAAAEQILRQGN